MKISTWRLGEGRDHVAEFRFAVTDFGLQIDVKTRDSRRFVPFLAITSVDGKVSFALNGPRVRKGKLDDSGALENVDPQGS